MRILSPVGTFPVRLRRARLRDGTVVLDTEMGAWHSEVLLERADVPLVAAAVGTLVVAYLAGRRAGRARR